MTVRRWGDAPARIVFGGDDAREMWTWECRLRDHEPKARTFNDVPTFSDAVAALDAHRRWHHADHHDEFGELRKLVKRLRRSRRSMRRELREIRKGVKPIQTDRPAR